MEHTPVARVLPMLARDTLYVGIDVSKTSHVAGFVCDTLLARHSRFEQCPSLVFAQSRAGFQQLLAAIADYVPLSQARVLIENTGHYHQPLAQFLLEHGIAVYQMTVHKRASRMMKSDKRDALGLANRLYNQEEKHVQQAAADELAYRVAPISETAQWLKALVRHHYELSQEAVRRKNKLTAICDEVFPEFTQMFKDPNLETALHLRETFPSPADLVAASLSQVRAAKHKNRPSDAKLAKLLGLARASIGTKDAGRLRGLLFEQQQLITELRLIEAHLATIEGEIALAVAASREGQIIASVIGPGIAAATLLAGIGSITNFRSAAALKAFCGWAPATTQTGSTKDTVILGRGGARPLRQAVYLATLTAIRRDTEWRKLYLRLVPKKCHFDARTRKYRGKMKVIGRIAGQLLTMIYALLSRDADLLARTPPGTEPEPPLLYDAAVHARHRGGHYVPLKPRAERAVGATPAKVATVLPFVRRAQESGDSTGANRQEDTTGADER